METTTSQKPIQPQITVSNLLALPSIAQVIGKKKWTRDMRNGVAEALRNRRFIDSTGATGAEMQQYQEMRSTVQALLEGDEEFAAAKDPHYIIVQFPSGGAPIQYRGWLDFANKSIGGTDPTGLPPGSFIVNGCNENVQPLSLIDPTLQNLNLLMVNTQENAHYVAGQLLGHGLHAWVFSAADPPIFR